jgi:hypothetical protein
MDRWEYTYRPARVAHIDYNNGRIEAEEELRSGPLVPVPLDVIFDFVWSYREGRIHPSTPQKFGQSKELPEPAKVGMEIIIVFVRDKRWPSGMGYRPIPIGWGHRSTFERAEQWLRMDPHERALRLAISER